jgi:hypothetical protein
MSTFEHFTARAFRQGPASDANQLIDEVRSATQARLGAAVNYEVVLTGRPADYVRRVVGPRLAFFLRAKRYSVRSCGPVFLSVFLGDRIYFVTAEEFYKELQASQGLADEAFAALTRSWEATGRDVVGALPPPAGEPGPTGPGRGPGSKRS